MVLQISGMCQVSCLCQIIDVLMNSEEKIDQMILFVILDRGHMRIVSRLTFRFSGNLLVTNMNESWR